MKGSNTPPPPGPALFLLLLLLLVDLIHYMHLWCQRWQMSCIILPAATCNLFSFNDELLEELRELAKHTSAAVLSQFST